MLKLISSLIAGSIVLAPMLPAQAGFEIRSSGFGVTIGSPSSFGVQSGFGVQRGGFYRNRYPYGNRVIIRSPLGNPDYTYGSPRYDSPRFPNQIGPARTVIITPRTRTVIVNPGYYNPYRSNCGSAIYGSPIASPIPVNPVTGWACR